MNIILFGLLLFLIGVLGFISTEHEGTAEAISGLLAFFGVIFTAVGVLAFVGHHLYVWFIRMGVL